MKYIEDTGDVIDAHISQRLIRNLFFKNSPLHDGAVVIEGDRVAAARCTLPITEQQVPASFGMRHKAAIGISEESDATVIVVSEETGGISYIKEIEKERLTKTGMTMGTPEYMSPEQCHGDEVTIQSDIYSMGVILYEMTCGRLPFEGSRPVEIAIKHVQEPPPDPKQFRENMPRGLSELILKCLNKKLNERFHDMQEFLDACDQVFPQGDHHKTAKLTGSHSLLKRSGVSITEAATHLPARVRIIKRRLTALAISLFPLLIILMILLMLTHKPESTLREIEWDEALGNFETTVIEPDADGYPLDNLTDGDLTTAWLNTMPSKPQNPVLTLFFDKNTLVTHIGFATGYQKSKDDPFGDRFRIFKKPKALTLETKDGFKQTVTLENIKGMQYPKIQAMETNEIRVYLEDVYDAENKDFAISEIRLLGMEL